MYSSSVLHDGAPNVGANWAKDAFTQSELVLYSLKTAASVLKPGGMFITKVFRSRDYNATMWVLNQFFNKVEATKPKASRDASAEIYVVCLGYKAPKQIDPKLFDPAYIFEDVQEQKQTLKHLTPAFLAQRRNRNREGYEDGVLSFYSACPVAEFIDSNNPVAVLAAHYELKFDDASQRFLEHESTTEEIKRLCEDLKVLGMTDFKHLLKWRLKMRRFRETFDQEDMADDSDSDDDISSAEMNEENKEDDDDDLENKDDVELQNEYLELRSKSKRRQKNKIKKEKTKEAKRMPLPSAMTERSDDILDNIEEATLFTLSSLNDRKELERALDVTKAASEYDEHERDAEAERHAKKPQEVSNVDQDEYDALIESQLESMYDTYLETRSKRVKSSIFKAAREKQKETDDLYDALEEEEELAYEKEDNPLLVTFDGKKDKKSKKTEQWFSQNIFDVLNEDDDTELGSKKKKRRVSEDDSAKSVHDDDDDDDGESDDELYDDLRKRVGADGVATGNDEEEVETVPQEMHDEETRAETLALAAKLLRKKERREFIDNAFHRYAFNDDNMPSWFVDDERDAHRRTMPITKEEVERQKARFREINDRTVKRVLEAKARKKRDAAAKMAKMKAKANTIAESQELSNHEKARELQRLYKKAQQDTKQKKVYVVGRSFKAGGGGGKYAKGTKVVRVDPRLKKDKRGEKRARQR